MSFRQFGGISYAAKHNVVSSNYNTSNNLLVTQNVGQPNSNIVFLSDISGNINIDISGNINCNGNLYVSRDVDISGNTQMDRNLNVNGNTFIGNNLGVGENTIIYQNLDVNGNTFIGQNLSVNGNTQLDENLDVSGNTFIGHNLDVSGNTQMDGNLDVSGNTQMDGNLDVNGNTQMDGNLDVNGNTFIGHNLDISGNTFIGHNLDVNGNTQMDGNLDVSGNTFIGQNLDVYNNLYIKNNTDISGNTLIGNNLYVSKDVDISGNTQIHGNLDISGNITCQTGSFSYLSSTNNTYLATTNGQSVGIGKSSALTGYILDVSGNVAIDGTTTCLKTLFLNNISNNSTSLNIKSNLGIYLDGSGNGIFLNNGNVGIGKTTASYSLDISGNVSVTNTNPTLYLTSNPIISTGDNPIGSIIFNNGGSNSSIKSYLDVLGANNNSDLRFYTSLDYNSYNQNLERMRIDRSGNVGIGTTAPSAILDVSGNAIISGQVTAGSFNSTSDYRLKTNIKQLDSYAIDNLNPVEYDINGRHDMGFIAHELQEYYPFLVNGEKDGKKMQSINYTGLIALLVKEIQDLKIQIQELKLK